MAFYQSVINSPLFKNYAFYVSISNCGENESKGYQTFQISHGDLLISNINSTNNKCLGCSSLYCNNDGKTSTCNFSTFRENNQTDSQSLCFDGPRASNSNTVSYCNVIGNKCKTDNDQVLFSCTHTTSVHHCIFRNNTAKYMFGGRYLTISDSYIDINSTYPVWNVTFENLTENYNFNNFINFYKENCLIEPKEITIKISYLSKFMILIFPSLLLSN